MFVDYGIINKCKNLYESYGEICVHCNACGRFDKSTKTESEINVLNRVLEDTNNPNPEIWFDDEELRKLQETNRQKQIKYLRKRISKLYKENKLNTNE